MCGVLQLPKDWSTTKREFLEALGERLTEAASLKGATREGIASNSEPSQDSVSRWEKAEVEAQIYNLFSVAQAYGVNVGWLIGEDTALSPEEEDTIQAMRDSERPYRRRAILVATYAEGQTPNRQSPPLRRVAEDQGSYQTDSE